MLSNSTLPGVTTGLLGSLGLCTSILHLQVVLPHHAEGHMQTVLCNHTPALSRYMHAWLRGLTQICTEQVLGHLQKGRSHTGQGSGEGSQGACHGHRSLGRLLVQRVMGWQCEDVGCGEHGAGHGPPACARGRPDPQLGHRC